MPIDAVKRRYDLLRSPETFDTAISLTEDVEMAVARLEPGSFYWATSRSRIDVPTIVQVSTIFGEAPDFWTLVTVGTDQHFMVSDFNIIAPVIDPTAQSTLCQAAE